MPSLRELVVQGTELVSKSSSTPRLDAELLLAHVMGFTRVQLFSRSEDQVTSAQEEKFRALIFRRQKHEPIAYLIGTKEFFGIPFKVTPDVLIPRPETETLVERALLRTSKMQGQLRILDLGTGSGCIAVALASELASEERDFRITAVDQSEKALSIAQENAASAGVLKKIRFLKGDWLSALHPEEEKFSLVVANPPYVAKGDSDVSPEIYFEPEQALYATNGGLDAIRVLLGGVPRIMSARGIFLCEMGSKQRTGIEELARQTGMGKEFSLEFFQDLAGLDRGFELTLS